MTKFMGLRIDRIDSRGNICEHILREHSDYPLCGVALDKTQPPLGNRTCKNCLKVYARAQHNKELHNRWDAKDKNVRGDNSPVKSAATRPTVRSS